MRKNGQDSLPQSLRDALHDMVLNSPIPAKAQAEELGVPLSYLYNAANPQLEGFEYQLRLLTQHTRITGNFSAIDFLERALGRVAIPLRSSAWPRECSVPQDLLRALLRSTKELGGVADTLHRSAKEGPLTESEVRKARKNTFELLATVTKLYWDLTQVEESFQ